MNKFYINDNEINNLIDVIRQNNIPVHLYNVTNQTKSGNILQYIKNNISSNINNLNRFDIFILNSHHANELGLYLDSNIKVYKSTDKVYFIITKNGIDYENKILIYIAYKINNKSRTSIFSNNDFSKVTNINLIPIDIKVLQEAGVGIYPHGHYLRIDKVANIVGNEILSYRNLSSFMDVEDEYLKSVNSFDSMEVVD